jgi:hypothetical protein
VRTRDVASAPESLSITLTGEKRLVVEDTYGPVAGGRALELVRRYVELHAARRAHTVTGDHAEDLEQVETCAVEGRRVRFAWSPEERGYRASLADPAAARAVAAAGPADQGAATGGEADALAGLVADMDLLAFLPSAPVAPGDEWAVPFDAFRWAVLRPGGEPACRSEPPRGETEEQLAARLWASLAGEIGARYAGRRERDGARLGAIAFRGRYQGACELGLAEAGLRGRRMAQSTEVEGELLWDLDRGRAHSLAMTSRGSVSTIDDILVDGQGTARPFERELRFAETSTLAVRFE